MTPDDGFFALHRDLPREGPGQAEDVHWALYAAAVPEDARIADLACGPGADTRTLAKVRGQRRGSRRSTGWRISSRRRAPRPRPGPGASPSGSATWRRSRTPTA